MDKSQIVSLVFVSQYVGMVDRVKFHVEPATQQIIFLVLILMLPKGLSAVLQVIPYILGEGVAFKRRILMLKCNIPPAPLQRGNGCRRVYWVNLAFGGEGVGAIRLPRRLLAMT